jgi:hypothetical protein
VHGVLVLAQDVADHHLHAVVCKVLQALALENGGNGLELAGQSVRQRQECDTYFKGNDKCVGAPLRLERLDHFRHDRERNGQRTLRGLDLVVGLIRIRQRVYNYGLTVCSSGK